MDYSVLMQAISTVGFPIAMCCAMFWKINTSDEQHKEEIGKLSEALNNNTLVMQRLVEKIGKGGDV